MALIKFSLGPPQRNIIGWWHRGSNRGSGALLILRIDKLRLLEFSTKKYVLVSNYMVLVFSTYFMASFRLGKTAIYLGTV